MNKNNKKEIIRLLSYFGNFESNKDTNAYLKCRGYNLSELEEEGDEFLSKMVAKARMKEGENKRRLFEKAHSLLEKMNIENPIEELKRRLQSKADVPAFSFSKLEKISDKDAIGMLRDEELLYLIEELEEDSKNG